MFTSDYKKKLKRKEISSSLHSLLQRIVEFTLLVLLLSCEMHRNNEQYISCFFDPRIDYNKLTVKDIDDIIRHGADVNEISEDSISVMFHVTELTDKSDIIRKLVKKGARLDFKDKDGYSILSHAASYNTNPLVIRTLNSLGCDVNEINSKSLNRTPIVRAIENNPNPEVITELIKLGATIDNDNTMLHIRLDKILNTNLLKLNTTITDPWKLTPYHLIASYRNETGIINKVFNKDNINCVDKYGLSILARAAINNKTPEIIKLLVNKGADLNQMQNSVSILMLAAGSSIFSQNVDALITEGMKVNYQNELKWTALHIAMYNSEKSHDIASVLINRGAKINLKDIYGDSPLVTCVRYNKDLATLKLLLNYGADVNEKVGDEYNSSVLTIAASNSKNPDFIPFLVKAGADKKYITKDGNNILSWALMNNQPYSVIKTILDIKVDVNHINKSGHTPLMIAAQISTDPKVIGLLLGNGADASIKDKEGKTAMLYVDRKPNINIRNSKEFDQLKHPRPRWISRCIGFVTHLL